MRQNTIDLSQLSVLPLIEHVDADLMASSKMHENEDRLKNHKMSYEVTEAVSTERLVTERTRDKASTERKKNNRDRRNRSHMRGNAKPHHRERTSTHDKRKKRHH